MKNMLFIMVFLIFFGFLAFGETGGQEEIDFLLFLPNSGNQFVHEDQAMIQLDNVAGYLLNKNPVSGQIYVYGYAAAAANDIEPVGLSRDRALFVISELQKRGLSGDLFADPIAYGSVDLWGSNADEEDRGPNRRVRILLDGNILTPAVVQAPEPEIQISKIEPVEKPAPHEKDEPRSRFPWWVLLALLAVLALLLLALKRKKRPAQESKLVPIPVPLAPIEKIKVLEEEEIRLYAYGLYELRNGRNGNAEGDWYRAICELTAYYETRGYRVILYWEQEKL